MGEVDTEGLNDRAAGCRCSSDLPVRLANVYEGACDHRRGLPAADRRARRCSATRRRRRRQCMMVHCTVVQPFIVIVGSIELQSSERAEAQGGRSWVELWAAGRGGCCCCLRNLAELPGASGP